MKTFSEARIIPRKESNVISNGYSLFDKLLFYSLISLPAIVSRMVRRLSGNKNINRQRRKIIIFQPGHFGDMIQSLPFLHNLKMNEVNSEITLVVGGWNYDLAKRIKSADKVIKFDYYLLNRGKKDSFVDYYNYYKAFMKQINDDDYDLGIDLRWHINSLYLLYMSNIKEIAGFNYRGHGSLLSYKVDYRDDIYEKDRLLSLLPIMGYKIYDVRFVWDIECDSSLGVEIDKYFLKQGANRSIIGIFPGAPFKPRRWPANEFAELISNIREKELGTPFLIGGERDKQVIYDIIGMFPEDHIPFWIGNDIDWLIGIFKKCKCLVSNDTGPMHLAVALDVPTVALFGPGNHKRWAPRPPHIAIIANVPCSPCELNSDKCNNIHNECMAHIKVDDVIKAIRDVTGQ